MVLFAQWFYIGHSSSQSLIYLLGSAVVFNVYFTETRSNSCMFISVISTPVQSSFNSLQGDISQQMETVMNGVSSQKEKMTELERRIQKVNMYLYGQEYSRLMRLRRFCLPISVTDYWLEYFYHLERGGHSWVWFESTKAKEQSGLSERRSEERT